MSDSVIHLEEIKKSYIMGKQELQVLKGISLDILRNEYVALMGPSGSGKSTLMNILGCLDSPTSGKYILNGHDVSTMLDNNLADIRNKEIGFVFQQLRDELNQTFVIVTHNEELAAMSNRTVHLRDGRWGN